jgi:hypothetical protein
MEGCASEFKFQKSGDGGGERLGEESEAEHEVTNSCRKERFQDEELVNKKKRNRSASSLSFPQFLQSVLSLHGS